MSFTTNIKNEIVVADYSPSELIAELSSIININAIIDKEKFSIYTENFGVSRRIYKLLKELYNIEIIVDKEQINRLNKNYIIRLIVKEKKDLILKDLNIINSEGKRLHKPQDYIVDGLEEKHAYLRGAFLICGSVNDPKTSRYHLEFIIENKTTANFINKLLNDLNFNSKVLKREKHYMVYLKESEKISDFIKLLNAYNSLFYYEDIRIYRDHKNMTNRLNNMEQANIEKTINACNEQINDINLIYEKLGEEFLDEKVKEATIYRLKYPESSLQELSESLSSVQREYIKAVNANALSALADRIKQSFQPMNTNYLSEYARTHSLASQTHFQSSMKPLLSAYTNYIKLRELLLVRTILVILYLCLQQQV